MERLLGKQIQKDEEKRYIEIDMKMDERRKVTQSNDSKIERIKDVKIVRPSRTIDSQTQNDSIKIGQMRKRQKAQKGRTMERQNERWIKTQEDIKIDQQEEKREKDVTIIRYIESRIKQKKYRLNERRKDIK